MGLTLFLRPRWRSELTLRPQEAEVMCDSASAPERQPTQGTKFGGQPGNDQFSCPLFFTGVCAGMCMCDRWYWSDWCVHIEEWCFSAPGAFHVFTGLKVKAGMWVWTFSQWNVGTQVLVVCGSPADVMSLPL